VSSISRILLRYSFGMSRLLRAAASVSINLFVALFATTLIQSPLLSLFMFLGSQSPVLRVQTQAGFIERSFAVNFLAACLLGYSVYRILCPMMAKWIWPAGASWIGIRAMLALSTRHRSVLEPWQPWALSTISFVWSSLIGTGCGSIQDATGVHCWQSFFLTQFAMRPVAYSVGAILCERLGHTGSFPLAEAWLVRFRALPASETSVPEKRSNASSSG
jgi:hypothetical protein